MSFRQSFRSYLMTMWPKNHCSQCRLGVSVPLRGSRHLVPRAYIGRSVFSGHSFGKDQTTGIPKLEAFFDAFFERVEQQSPTTLV